MSGIEDPGPPPELPEEYADVYREAYLRALAEAGEVEQVTLEPARGPSRSERARAEKAARAERVQAEKARAAQARAEKARLDKERAEQARREAARAAEIRAEKAYEAQSKAVQDRLEQARAEKARAEEKARADRLRAAEVIPEPVAAVEQVEAAPVEQAPDASETVVQEDVRVPVPADEDRTSRMWLVVAAVAVLLIIAAYVAGDLISDDEPSGPQPVSAASESPQSERTRSPRPAKEPTKKPAAESLPTTSLGPLYDGDVDQVVVEGSEASCTAPQGVDSANQPVSYTVENAVDDDTSTAWRCNGQARGETLTFTLPAGTEVAEVGLVPGYAKTDPRNGTDRYAENNRITKVRWILADGVVFDQELDPDPDDRSVQTVRTPRTATGKVTLEIRSVERGDRNTTAISSVVIAAAR